MFSCWSCSSELPTSLHRGEAPEPAPKTPWLMAQYFKADPNQCRLTSNTTRQTAAAWDLTDKARSWGQAPRWSVFTPRPQPEAAVFLGRCCQSAACQHSCLANPMPTWQKAALKLCSCQSRQRPQRILPCTKNVHGQGRKKGTIPMERSVGWIWLYFTWRTQFRSYQITGTLFKK